MRPRAPDALLDLNTLPPLTSAESGELLAGGIEALFARLHAACGAFEQLDVLGAPRLAGDRGQCSSAAF